jgi:predicted ATP-grasp superfamily ATP-dependent carboligase
MAEKRAVWMVVLTVALLADYLAAWKVVEKVDKMVV